MHKAFLLAAAAMLATNAWAINRCTGPDGKVTYTEAPCPVTATQSSRVTGTGDSTAERQRAQTMRNIERDELDLQRDRTGTERDRVRLQREKAQLAREQDRDKLQNSSECLAARESLRHQDNYERRAAMRTACGVSEPLLSERPHRSQSNCPDEQAIRNMEAQASSIMLKPYERSALQQRIAQARACR